MRIAVIPARGGSKRIPLKNIKKFIDKPIIAWSIKAALDSECFDKVIVSTDNKEIANVSRYYGAEVPFIRPNELSDDFIGTTPVMQHATQWLIQEGISVEFLCCIYATAPFLDPSWIADAWDKIFNSKSNYVFSVTSYPFPIQRALKIKDNGSINMLNNDFSTSRSQDLEDYWHDAGQFYWGKKDAWLDQKPILNKNSMPYILPRYRVQDIDTEEDWIQAEIMMKVLKNIDEKI
jgi:pseudaminic acid cytidylyltransferase